MEAEAVSVLFANGLGDHLLALPTLRALQRRFSGKLSLLSAGGPTELLLGGIDFARSVTVPMEVADGGRRFFDGCRAAQLLEPTDVFISLATWDSSSVTDLLQALRPSLSVGLHPGFDVTVVAAGTRHRADRLFEVARYFDPTAILEEFTAPIDLPPDSVRLAADLRRAVGENRRLLVVHAETSTPEKRWAPERMEEALRRLCADLPDLFVVAISHGAPCLDLESVGRSATAASGVSIGTFLAIVAAGDLFLGVDSFGLHAADLWQVPAVGLFGMTSPAEYGFRFSPNNAQLSGKGDTSGVSVGEVIAAVQAVARLPGRHAVPRS